MCMCISWCNFQSHFLGMTSSFYREKEIEAERNIQMESWSLSSDFNVYFSIFKVIMGINHSYVMCNLNLTDIDNVEKYQGSPGKSFRKLLLCDFIKTYDLILSYQISYQVIISRYLMKSYHIKILWCWKWEPKKRVMVTQSNFKLFLDSKFIYDVTIFILTFSHRSVKWMKFFKIFAFIFWNFISLECC